MSKYIDLGYGGVHEFSRELDSKERPVVFETLIIGRQSSSPIHRHCFKTKTLEASWGGIDVKVGETLNDLKTVHLSEGQTIKIKQGIWCQITNPSKSCADVVIKNQGELIDHSDIIYAPGQNKKTDGDELGYLFRTYYGHVSRKIDPKRVFRPGFIPAPK